MGEERDTISNDGLSLSIVGSSIGKDAVSALRKRNNIWLQIDGISDPCERNGFAVILNRSDR
jgi:hypothetical protein